MSMEFLCSHVISRGNCSGGVTKCQLFSQARRDKDFKYYLVVDSNRIRLKSFLAQTAGPLNLLKGQRGNGIKTTTKNGHSCKSKR